MIRLSVIDLVCFFTFVFVFFFVFFFVEKHGKLEEHLSLFWMLPVVGNVESEKSAVNDSDNGLVLSDGLSSNLEFFF